MVSNIKLSKTKYLIFSFFLISSFNCFSQKNVGVAIYKVKTSYAFNNIEKEKEKEVLNKIFEDSGKESSIKFKLLFKEDKSIFFAEKSLEKENEKVDFVSIKAKILGRIFVNLTTKELIQSKEKFGELFNIKSSLNNYDWILTKETIKIGDYTCFKAILKGKGNKKNETIAWYAPELTYRIGPLGYCGLPGLVIVLKDDIFIYTLTELKFNLSKQDEKSIKKPKVGIEVSTIEYDSIYKVMRDRKDQLEKEN